MPRLLRHLLVAAVCGVLLVSAAWAGAGLAPVRDTVDPDETAELDGAGETAERARDASQGDGGESGEHRRDDRDDDEDDEGATQGEEIPDDAAVLDVGAAVTSIEPAPDTDAGEVWETDYDACATLSPSTLENIDEFVAEGAHLASTGSPWPENPDCIYMGGYGIGPMFPVTEVDETHGFFVRAIALRDAEGDTMVVAVIDGEGWFWDYADKCDDCGIKQISQRVGDELGIDPAGITIASTHAHTSPDFIGGWGFVPDWYMEQVTTSIESTITEAVEGAVPAVVEVGEQLVREHNSERRGTYRSAEEPGLGWLRGLAVEDGRYLVDDDGDQIVTGTLGTYAAHPTSAEHTEGHGHADWPGLFTKGLEERFGGVGVQAMTGLGNMSSSGGTQMGAALAEEVPDIGDGRLLTDDDIEVSRTTWRQPATNVPLTALGAGGFFDRQFDATPAEVTAGKSDASPCTSSSGYSVEVAASAARIGDELAVTAGPGELFANLSNTIKEESGAELTMPLAQANDALGYIPQSFEHSPVGQQGLGFVVDGFLVVNYEDAYAIDRCFGDMVLETTLGLLADLRSQG